MIPAEQTYNDGIEHATSERWAEALRCFMVCLDQNPASADVNAAAAVAAFKLGLLEEARIFGVAAVSADPENAVFLINLGRIHELSRNWAEAISCFSRAAEMGNADGTFWLGRLLHGLQLPSAGGRFLEEALRRQPGRADAWAILAACRCSSGEVPAAVNAWDHSLQLDPESGTTIASERLLALHYIPHSGDELAREHRRWGVQIEDKVAPLPPVVRNDRAKLLRLGFLQTHAAHNALRSFTGSLFEYLDRDQFDLVLFSDAHLGTLPPKLPGTQLYDTSNLTNDDFAALVRHAHIDIAIDLGAHSSIKGRLRALAARPAPMQVTAIGYPNTTGLTRIDYRLTDSIADPAGEPDEWYTERLLRLDPCFLCYTPPPDAPDVAVRAGSDPFVFGCFNTFPKLTPEVFAVWAAILDAAPGSMLVLKCIEFFDPDVRTMALQRLMAAGIDVSRVRILRPGRDQPAHLAAYSEMDLFLDPFPYNGTTTTCEALWMGVPGITLAGNTHVSRVGASVFSACHLRESIAYSKEEYIRLAIECARNAHRIREQRPTFRDAMARSVLLDAPSYARRWGELLQQAWSQREFFPARKPTDEPGRTRCLPPPTREPGYPR